MTNLYITLGFLFAGLTVGCLIVLWVKCSRLAAQPLTLCLICDDLIKGVRKEIKGMEWERVQEGLVAVEEVLIGQKLAYRKGLVGHIAKSERTIRQEYYKMKGEE